MIAILLFAACSNSYVSMGPTTPVIAPYSVSGGQDLSDHDCTVLLREISRISNGTGGYEVNVVDGSRYYVWEGFLEISEDAYNAGYEPAVIFNYQGDQWWEVEAFETEGSNDGFQRFVFYLDEKTPTEGMSYSSLQNTVIELVPFARQGDERLFDHNRNPGDFDNYILNYSNSWSIQDDGSVCQPVVQIPTSNLEFRYDWEEVQHGTIVPGGKLVVEYSPYRLTECFNDTYMGVATWNTNAYVKFLPSNQVFSGGVVDCGEFKDCAIPKMKPFEVDIPADTTGVELWFNTSGRSCGTTWDSNYGENYYFETGTLPLDPSWAGDKGYCLSRGSDLRSENVPETIVIDSWVLTRADIRYIDSEVYVQDITDIGADPSQIIARAQVSRDGADPVYHWLDFEGRVDNNHRFSWNLMDEDMMYTPWDSFEVDLVFSTDGQNWVSSGPTTLLRSEDWCPETYWGDYCK